MVFASKQQYISHLVEFTIKQDDGIYHAAQPALVPDAQRADTVGFGQQLLEPLVKDVQSLLDETEADSPTAAPKPTESGLLAKHGGSEVEVPLKAVHIKASLLGTHFLLSTPSSLYNNSFCVCSQI